MNISASPRANSSVSIPPVSNIQSIEDPAFKDLLAEAKGRLTNPFSQTSPLMNISGSDTVAETNSLSGMIAPGTGATSVGSEFDQVDAMNNRVFSEIYSTIQNKLAILKQNQAASEVNHATIGLLSELDTQNLVLMAKKVAEYYGTSLSADYKKQAEKTLAKIMSKLASQSELGNRVASDGLQSLVGVFKDGTVPQIVLSSFIDDDVSLTKPIP